jgi:hypothetical protein
MILPLIVKSPSINAQGSGPTGERIKIIETTMMQYIWNLVTTSGELICTVMINHEGFPTGSETLSACSQGIAELNPTVTPLPGGGVQPTATPININQVFLDTYWVFVKSGEVTQTTNITIPDIIINIYAPGIPVVAPYVVIKAIEPYSEYKITRIAGIMNGDPFECLSDQCIVPIIQNSQIQFWAESSYGDQTEPITATVRTFISNNYYNIRITAIDRLVEFTDSCRESWTGTGYGESPDWVIFPDSPELLNTSNTLHYLVGKLILHKFVDASSCPDGGLFANGAPNACGLEVAKTAMDEWQNRFDPTIWAAGKEYGIPPILIKSLIEQESQFWPENARYIYEEFGFTQINELGADAALRWDEDLKNQICSSLLFDCDPSFAKMNSFEQAMLRGGLIQSIDAYCPACENMVDLSIAEQSISVSTQVLRANCYQTNYIMDNQGLKATYADLWKFTILSYHAGYYCLENALIEVKNKGLEPTWSNVSANLNCQDARIYVDSVWDKLTSFQLNYAPLPTLSPLMLTPTGQSGLVEIPPTATPIPSPTPKTYLTDGIIHIFLYLDSNNNLVMDEDELINNATLSVLFANGIKMNIPVIKGEGIINYQGQFKNSNVVITVEELYKTIEIKIPESGELYNIIRIPPPDLPEILP